LIAQLDKQQTIYAKSLYDDIDKRINFLDQNLNIILRETNGDDGNLIDPVRGTDDHLQSIYSKNQLLLKSETNNRVNPVINLNALNKKKRKQNHLKAYNLGNDSNVNNAGLIDSNEPVYCTCKNISYGQMIACENPDCLVEWFHFGCVGLVSEVSLIIFATLGFITCLLYLLRL
jgi:hypothetical protein